MPGVVIAGTHSGCGKTTVTLGILAALKKKGLSVQAFKAGPDYIDTGLHRLITGRPSRNLDIWMCGEDYVRDSFYRNAQDADVAVVEGVMGLYDGEFSTAYLAKTLGLPVILVVDAYGMAESAGAVVRGFIEHGEGINFAGVIFNRIASENHFQRVRDSVRDIPVLGYLPRDTEFKISHRHLGLKTAEESPLSANDVERLADAVLKDIDIELIQGLQVSFPQVSAGIQGLGASLWIPDNTLGDDTSKVRIAVAYDHAFSFYYADNLDLLAAAGAEFVFFSPISDSAIPAGVEAIYIGGGYPELYAKQLSANVSMLSAIKGWADAGKPLYAECGGLMYLSTGIHDFNGNFFKMAGVFPFETRMKHGRSRLGYREVQLREDCLIGRCGDNLRGHEFHYSEITDNGQDVPEIYSVTDNAGKEMPPEGYKFRNTLASYIHIHFGSHPEAAGYFVARGMIPFKGDDPLQGACPPPDRG